MSLVVECPLLVAESVSTDYKAGTSEVVAFQPATSRLGTAGFRGFSDLPGEIPEYSNSMIEDAVSCRPGLGAGTLLA